MHIETWQTVYFVLASAIAIYFFVAVVRWLRE